MRLQMDFKCRAAFEASADDLSDACREKIYATSDILLDDHRQHLHRTKMHTHGRLPTDDELQNLEAMLHQRGVAEKLRLFMCAGADAVLLRSDMKEMLYAAFAALGQSRDRTMQQYTNWVGRLATREYADELVVLAVALELKVKIVCVLDSCKLINNHYADYGL